MSEPLQEKKELARMREDMARTRIEMSHSLAERREASKEVVRHQRQQQNQELALKGNLDAMKLSHQLDVEVRDRDFADSVREENLRLQSLGSELAVRWQYEKAQSQHEHNLLMEQLQGEIMKTHSRGQIRAQTNGKRRVVRREVTTLQSRIGFRVWAIF